MVFAMRHGVRFYEAMDLIRRLLNFRYSVLIYEATRGGVLVERRTDFRSDL